MDYEFKIRQAELELAHLREMKALQGSRLDAHDQSLETMHTILNRVIVTADRTSANLDRLALKVDQLVSQQDKLEGKMDQLIDALLHGQARNGGHGGKA